MLESARDAFTAGMKVGAAAGAVTFIGLAILAARALRHAHPYGETRDDPADDTHSQALDLADQESARVSV
jgi:hypothetical protein